MLDFPVHIQCLYARPVTMPRNDEVKQDITNLVAKVVLHRLLVHWIAAKLGGKPRRRIVADWPCPRLAKLKTIVERDIRGLDLEIGKYQQQPSFGTSRSAR